MPRVASISQQIWDMKYRLKGADGAPVDKTIEESWRRVADALAVPQTEVRLFGKPESFRKRRMGVALARGADTGEARARAKQAASLVIPRFD